MLRGQPATSPFTLPSFFFLLYLEALKERGFPLLDFLKSHYQDFGMDASIEDILQRFAMIELGHRDHVASCQIHGGSLLCSACLTCGGVLLCETCAVSHERHIVDSIPAEAGKWRRQLAAECDVVPLETARASLRTLGNALETLRATAEGVRRVVEQRQSNAGSLTSALYSELLVAVSGAEVLKVAGIEAEIVAADAAVELADSTIADIRTLLDAPSSSLPDVVFLALRGALQTRLSAVRADLASIPPSEDLPVTDATLELEVVNESGPPDLITTNARPVDPIAMKPGLIVLTAPVSKGGRRAMILECDDPDRVLLVVEAVSGQGPELEEAAALVASSEIFLHPNNGSWSGCGGRPSGVGQCCGSGNCGGPDGVGCTPGGCGAGKRHTCCGSPDRHSGNCLPGVTREQAEKNASALWTEHDLMRCDEVPGVLFPPAAYHASLATLAPPAEYGSRVIMQFKDLLQSTRRTRC